MLTSPNPPGKIAEVIRVGFTETDAVLALALRCGLMSLVYHEEAALKPRLAVSQLLSNVGFGVLHLTDLGSFIFISNDGD